MDKEPKYTNDDLKVSSKKKVSPFSKLTESQEIAEVEVEEEIGSKDVFTILFTILFGYLLYAIIPTLVLTQLVGLGFGLSSLITFALAVVLFFALGLYKPATPEQLAKRDMNRRRKRKK